MSVVFDGCFSNVTSVAIAWHRLVTELNLNRQHITLNVDFTDIFNFHLNYFLVVRSVFNKIQCRIFSDCAM